MERQGCNMKNCFWEYNMFIVISSCLLSPIIVMQSLLIYGGEIHKNPELRARFATFAINTVDNLCLLQQHKWNTINVLSCRD